MATGYEFLGLQETLAAFEARNVDSWAVFSGTRFIMKGQGMNELEQFLAMIARSGTSAIYTLKVYEDLPAGTKLNSKTPDDGSYNFKLFDLYGNSGALSGALQPYRVGSNPADLKKLIQEAIDEMTPPEPEAPGVLEQMGDAFIGMLQEPRKLAEFIGALTGQPVRSIPTVGAVTRVGSAETAEIINEATAPRISGAVERLGRVDGAIVEHLEKLATMAENEPGRFKMLVGLLDSE